MAIMKKYQKEIIIIILKTIPMRIKTIKFNKAIIIINKPTILVVMMIKIFL